MRYYTRLGSARFAKPGEEFATVTLPHTWNNLDGQDGGDDYCRCTATYEIDLPDPTPGKEQYIEFRGANHVATVWCNGQKLGSHEGGFSAFRFRLTDVLGPEKNLLRIAVSNEKSHVYPQRADFTFYGGLYRDVFFIETEKPHFDLLKSGTDAVFVTAFATGETRLDVFPVNSDGCDIRVTLLDGEGNAVLSHTQSAQAHTQMVMDLKNPHLWDSVDDPYCYRAQVTLLEKGTPVDQVTVTYGYRSFRVDPDRGFFLNGRSYPLHGVCRHQDRINMGWAISQEEHRQDAQLIREVGANTIRLAHYQHDSCFYDLCDRMGFVVWAEIPYISLHLDGPEAEGNALSQLRELIAQCYNHPSIVVWGIGNEITVTPKPESEQTLCRLNALAKALDPNRLTTIAHYSQVPFDHPHTRITDLQGYNIYFGWYLGSVEENGPFMDRFHAVNPQLPLCISEYGVENRPCWHSAMPFNHDYTEEYAVFYHQEMLKAFRERPYLWATHMWNMFDFAADARNEGGEKGRNNKGLVTYDRQTKKDIFFLYKAWWTKTPMVHIAGRRFAHRAPEERTVLVFTNGEAVTLTLNGKAYTAPAVDHIATFPELPMTIGENTLTAAVPGASDRVVLYGTETHDTRYDLPDLAAALQAGNWFLEGDDQELDYGEKGFHAQVGLNDLLSHPRCMDIVKGWVMSKTEVNISQRFNFVTALPRFASNRDYKDRTLDSMPTLQRIMTQQDWDMLNKLLRAVKYK